MATDHPLFNYRYLDRSKVLPDSSRFRVRVAAALTLTGDWQVAGVKALKAQAGLEVPYANWGYDFDTFWKKSPTGDVLTAITVLYRYSAGAGLVSAKAFRDAVAAALADEHLQYRIDEHGVIHYAVDDDFEVARVVALQGLADPRLKDAREAYESAHKYMNGVQPDTRQAVRRAFEAVEIVARQLVPAHKNLNANLCKNELKALCVQTLTKDAIEKNVLELMFDGMADWVAALHFYRHGQPESAPPSVDTAVFVLTSASGYLRLMARVATTVLPK